MSRLSYTLLRISRSNAIKNTNVGLRCFCKNVEQTSNSAIKRIEVTSTDISKEQNLSSNNPARIGYVDETLSKIQTSSNKCNNVENSVELKSNDVISLDKLEDDVKDIWDDVNTKPLDPLDTCTEDLSHIGPYYNPIYTFAKYANQSETIKQLVQLGVDFSKMESDKDLIEMFLTLDFEKDIKPYLEFLRNCGVPADNLAYFIKKNPRIFKEDMNDLHTRIRYLRAHNFTIQMIEKIVNGNPMWLNKTTKDIDSMLGHFQHTFKLKGHEIRNLSTKCPTLMTYKLNHIKESTFAVKEEMGFDSIQMKHILLTAPRIWINSRFKVVSTFNYAHNEMKLSHNIIAKQPRILLCRKKRLEERHKFLVELKRDQYNPLKPMYVSPLDIISGTDIEFSVKVAKSDIETYNMFLKSF